MIYPTDFYEGVICMKGSIGYAKNVKRYYLKWYYASEKKTIKIYKYKGQYLETKKLAEKLLATMQGDTENGVFLLEKYTRMECDIIPYLRDWLEAVKDTISPATYKDYKNSIEKHLVPFFQTKTLQLHEIQYDTLMQLLSTIKRSGKGKMNVMYCLHTCLDYAWKARRIPMVPPFPEKKMYNIVQPSIEWVSSDRQKKIIEAIPIEHQPIFWFLKYHLRRPGEAMALRKEDFKEGVFEIKRGFSARVNVERTKTGEIHLVPMVSEFAVYMDIEAEKQREHCIISPYLFIHPQGRLKGKHYTHTTLNDLWNTACAIVGETIGLYSGTKHSSCSQMINEYGYSIHEVQMATDHARLESVKKYAKVEVSARKALLERKVVHLTNSGTFLARNKETKD